VSIFNRRNAFLGWGIWQVTKRVAKVKAKRATPGVEGGRKKKSLIAVAVASAAGALTFWRRHRSSAESS
jgi:hypothetical protein